MSKWIALVTSSPSDRVPNQRQARHRLEEAGAAVLRDDIYLMPESDACRTMLETVASDFRLAKGLAFVISIEEPSGGDFAKRFDRGNDYAILVARIAAIRDSLAASSATEAVTQVRKLRATFASLSDIDFFPGESRKQAELALLGLEQVVTGDPDFPAA
ncbi:hypothetical protein [Vogesella indigofera]|uniref:hypothetical protein n=1 Tax=Vogesella indigofera TaxID=45465 RepID=UPI0011C41BAD|nr:hypothetical protein [Vogesella indigofera]